MSVKENLILVLKGMCMGAADIVPGVSGGTIALILGIYRRFICSLKSLTPAFISPFFKYIVSLLKFKRDKKKLGEFKEVFFRIDFKFLIPLFTGIVISFGIGSKIIPHLMLCYPAPTFAFFFGLILVSAKIPLKLIPKIRFSHIVLIILSAALSFIFIGFQNEEVEIDFALLKEKINIHQNQNTIVYSGKIKKEDALKNLINSVNLFKEKNGLKSYEFLIIGNKSNSAEDFLKNGGWEGADYMLPQTRGERKEILKNHNIILFEKPASNLTIFLCGMIAISAMILPGVSGSFMLLFLGQYRTVLEALNLVISNSHSLVNLLFSDAGAFLILARDTRLFFLIFFIAGLVAGMAVFCRIMCHLLNKFTSPTMAALTGLMLGSLRKPAREILYTDILNNMPLLIVTLVSLAAGVLIIYFLDKYSADNSKDMNSL